MLWMSFLFSCTPIPTDPVDTGLMEAEDPALSFARDVLPIVQQHDCARCHLSSVTEYEEITANRAGYTDEWYNACINMMWIEPFEPDRSFLVHKIQGTYLDVGAQGGDVMPLDGATLSEMEIDIIREWIQGGALP